jgi:hypothetical protein
MWPATTANRTYRIEWGILNLGPPVKPVATLLIDANFFIITILLILHIENSGPRAEPGAFNHEVSRDAPLAIVSSLWQVPLHA